MILKLSTITSLVNYGAAVVLAWQYHEQLHEGLYIFRLLLIICKLS